MLVSICNDSIVIDSAHSHSMLLSTTVGVCRISFNVSIFWRFKTPQRVDLTDHCLSG